MARLHRTNECSDHNEREFVRIVNESNIHSFDINALLDNNAFQFTTGISSHKLNLNYKSCK